MSSAPISSSSHEDSTISPSRAGKVSLKLTDVQSRSRSASKGALTQLQSKKDLPVLERGLFSRQQSHVKDIKRVIVAQCASRSLGVMDEISLPETRKPIVAEEREDIGRIVDSLKDMRTYLENSTGVSLKGRFNSIKEDRLTSTAAIRAAFEELGKIADEFQQVLDYLSAKATFKDISPSSPKVESSSSKASSSHASEPKASSSSTAQVKGTSGEVLSRMEALTNKNRYYFVLPTRFLKLTPEDSRFVHMAARQMVQGKSVDDSVRRKIKRELGKELAGKSPAEREAIKQAFAEKFDWPHGPLSEFSFVAMNLAQENDPKKANMPPLSAAMKKELNELVRFSLEGLPFGTRFQFSGQLQQRMSSAANGVVGDMAVSLKAHQQKITEKEKELESLRAKKKEGLIDQSEDPLRKERELLEGIATLKQKYVEMLTTSHQAIMQKTLDAYVTNIGELTADYQATTIPDNITRQVERLRLSFGVDAKLIPVHQALKTEIRKPLSERNIFTRNFEEYFTILGSPSDKKPLPSKGLVDSYAAETALIRTAYLELSNEVVKEQQKAFDGAKKEFEDAKAAWQRVSKTPVTAYESETVKSLADKVGLGSIIASPQQIAARKKLIEKNISKFEASLLVQPKTDGDSHEVIRKKKESLEKQLALIKAFEFPDEKPALLQAFKDYRELRALSAAQEAAERLREQMKKLEENVGHAASEIRDKPYGGKSTPAEFLTAAKDFVKKLGKEEPFKAVKKGV